MYLINSDYNLPVRQNKFPYKNGIAKKLPFKALEPETRESLKVNSENIKAYFGVDNTTVISPKDKKPLTKEELSKYKNDMGQERFDDKEKGELIFLSEVYPFVRNLIKLETTTGKPRFTVKDIQYLADLHDIHPLSVTELAQIETSTHDPRFEAGDIDELLVTYELFPAETSALAKMETEYGEPRFKNYDIMNLTTAYYNNPEEVRELAKIKTCKGMPKFKGYEISFLSKIYKEHKDAINALSQIRSSQGYDRFNGEDIEDLAEIYEKHPKTVKELAAIEGKDRIFRFDGEDIRRLIPTFKKHPDAVRKLADIRTTKDSFRFSSYAIEDLAELYEKYPKVINSLAYMEDEKGKPKYNFSEIKQIADLCRNKELEKIITCNINKIGSCNNRSSDNYTELEIGNKIFHIKNDSKKNYKITGTEKISEESNITKTELEMADGSVKNENFSKALAKTWQGYIETVRDKDGHIVSRTLTKPSKRNTGVLVVLKEVFDKNGNLVEVKAEGTVKNYGEKNDRRRIERNFVSPLGVKSRQLILEVPKGKRTEYQAGNFICRRAFRKVDDNTTETYAWGNTYITKYNDDNSIEVTLLKKDGRTNTATLDKKQIDKILMPLMKKVPGDFLYNLAKNKTEIFMTHANNLKNNAGFSHNQILISSELKDDPATFAHEYGHVTDEILLKKLHKDKQLKEIFSKELDAYKSTATWLNEKQIFYFTAKNHENKGGCLTEVIAETVMLLSGLLHDRNEILLRTKILQENFPETIAYIGTKMQEVNK